MKGRSVEEDLLSQLVVAKIKAARKGDTSAAKWLLKEFCGAVKQATDKNGKQLQGPYGPVCVVRHNVLVYFSECFEQILSGVPADKALSTKKSESGAPRKPRNEIVDRHFLLCIEVMHLKKKCKTVKDAIQKVASNNGLKISAVEKAWKDRSANLAAELSARLDQGK